MTRQELKAKAKEQIKGNMGPLIVITLIVFAAAAICGTISGAFSSIATLVVTPFFGIATAIIYLKLCDGIKPEVAELFRHVDKFWAAFKVYFLTTLFTFLWLLLLIVPGIIKALSYSMSMYILAENPDMPAREAIDRSKEMMEGHKMELLVLQLSFLGWILLTIVTLGIAALYAVPYMNAAYANFYNSIKGEPAVE